MPVSVVPVDPFAIDAERVRNEIRGRRYRAMHLGEALFSDPAWDILLQLYEAELTNQEVTTASTCAALKIGHATACRWISAMESRGFVSSRARGGDTFVELSPGGSLAMRRYFEGLPEPSSSQSTTLSSHRISKTPSRSRASAVRRKISS